MNWKKELGEWGEDLALQYLMNKGYRLLNKNYRSREGEIDLIVLTPTSHNPELLVFVEVKTRSNSVFGDPIEAVSEKKISRLKKAADYFLHQNAAYAELPCRFDVLGIEYNGETFGIEHLEDAFY